MVVWLYLNAGASRSVTNAILRATHYLVGTILVLIQIHLSNQGITIKFPPFHLPRDVRAAYRRVFTEPKFKRKMCCPKCFHIYDGDPDSTPNVCEWKSSIHVLKPPCGTRLWTRRRTRKGAKKIPACLYTMQNFDDWLKFFLSRKVIDDALQETYRKKTANANSPPIEMRDVQDSPAWYELFGGKRGGVYDLAFGFYFDGFKTFKHKPAGE